MTSTPAARLIQKALHFSYLAAGEGLIINGESPEEFLLDYTLATDDEDWDTVADRILAALSPVAAEIARLTAERDAAIKALCEAATARGQAEGKLAASEMAGVVEGWKTRAEKAEAERDQALAQAAAAAMETRERAAEAYEDGSPEWDTFSAAATAIRTLPIDPDAQKALDKLLAKEREEAIREAADALTAVQERLEALEEALRPFAKSGELFPEEPGTVEFDICVYRPAKGREWGLCGDDLRLARAALAQPAGERT